MFCIVTITLTAINYHAGNENFQLQTRNTRTERSCVFHILLCLNIST